MVARPEQLKDAGDHKNSLRVAMFIGCGLALLAALSAFLFVQGKPADSHQPQR